MAEVQPLPPSIRISRIAGRYLVFDSEDVARLRRQENTCGFLVGTAPQQPTQNMFLGLPIELRPEEAHALVSKNAAHVVDDVAAHQAALKDPASPARVAYIDSLRRRKNAAQQFHEDKRSKMAAQVAQRLGRSIDLPPGQAPPASDVDADTDVLFDQSRPKPEQRTAASQMTSFAITPTCSGELVPSDTAASHEVRDIPQGPLCQFLQGSKYFMTPGLRFGSRYSVYPGDPLRFHAHFMTNQYGWDQEIPILDIVSCGRLATAVKKAFVFGGQDPGEAISGDASMRTFSVEWASM